MYVNRFGYKLKYRLEFIGCGFQEHYTTTFENGFGVSIIRGFYTYGGCKNLYEVAITNKNGDIIYDKLDNQDVFGFLTDSEVKDVINRVENL